MEGQDKLEFIEGVRQDTAGGNSVSVDYDLYADYLEDSDLTEEQKREFLQSLWTIICAFVDLGYGVHPVQQAKKACGKADQASGTPSAGIPDGVEYADHQLITKFEDVADRESGDAGKESVDAANC